MKKNSRKIYLLYTFLYIILAVLIIYKPNYIITKPGGIENIKNSYKIDSNNKIKGSVNITYLSTVKPNLLYYLYAKIRNWEITKISDYAPNGLEKEEKVDSLLYLSSIDNAIYNAYKYANSKINIKDEKVYVEYSLNDESELEEGDLILAIDDIKINKQDDIRNYLDKTDKTDVIVKYKRDNEIKTTNVRLINKNGKKYLGISVIDIFDYETDPKIEYSIKDDVAGPSGGAMITLSIYASLLDYDITKGLKIAGTGTIDRDGNIGPIGGVEYKIKSAIKSNVDVFFVPKYINYYEVLDLNLDFGNMDVVPVEEFSDILNYLKKK